MTSLVVSVYVVFFFFKQKTAYEMRISDWSSDVCSSDLRERPRRHRIHDLGLEAVTQRRQQGHRRRAPQLLDRIRDGTDEVDVRMPDHEIGRASCRERVCQYV